MTTNFQKKVPQENIRKAQRKWQSMSRRQRSRDQPEDRQRKKTGTCGSGDYHPVVIGPKHQFTIFRTQDLARSGHVQRIVGKRRSGSWDTQAWLIPKHSSLLYPEDQQLVVHDDLVENLHGSVTRLIHYVKGDIFSAKPRRNVPEANKPTAAQEKA